MFFRRWILGVGFCAAALPGLAHAAVTEDDFQLGPAASGLTVRRRADKDAMGTAALNFCQGFGVGVYRVLEEKTAGLAAHRICSACPIQDLPEMKRLQALSPGLRPIRISSLKRLRMASWRI